MEGQSSTELTWADRSFGELLRLAWPITVSTLSYSVMTLVDTLLVGHLGPSQLAGVGLAGTAAFVLLCFSLGLLRATKTLVSQAVGAGKPEEVVAYLGASLIFAAGIGVVTVGAGELLALALPYLTTSTAAGEAASVYLSIRIVGAPLVIWQTALRELRYGLGDARSPMVATLIANAINVALAAWFVYGLHWGVAGAAWATVIAHGVEAGVLMLVQSGLRSSLRVVTRRHLRAMWTVGLPTALQFSLEVGSFALLAAMVSSLSELQMAAHQIGIQVIHFSFLPAFGIAEAASVLAGQAVGAGRDQLVLKVARQALVLASVYTAAWTLVMAFGAPLLAAAFTNDAALIAVAVRLLHVAAIFQVFDGANIVARSTLRGTGDVRFPAVVGVVTSWACTPPLMWLLGYRMHLGAFGGWLGLCGEIVIASLLLWWRLERRGWHSAATLSRQSLQST